MSVNPIFPSPLATLEILAILAGFWERSEFSQERASPGCGEPCETQNENGNSWFQKFPFH